MKCCLARQKPRAESARTSIVAFATEMYERWQVGEKKSRLEIEYWDDSTSHGKRFTSYTKHWLG